MRNSLFFLKNAFSKPQFFLHKKPVSLAFASSSLGFCFSTFNLNEFYDITVPADLNDGQTKEVQVGPKKEDSILIARVDGKYYCVSNQCSHYGAPLSQGAFFGDKVHCPWHNAAFSVVTGKPDIGPMFDGLSTFAVTEANGQLKIKVDKELLNKAKTLPMVTKGNDKTHFVIVGGGVAALSAAETLRQNGFKGIITILSQENHLPYDRTGMSKFLYGVKPESAATRNREFLDKYGIEVKLQSTVENIDYRNREVKLANGDKLQYNKLLIATGGSARRPNIEGSALGNVHVLRTVNDVVQIQTESRKAKNIVIVGSSFIGLEAASALKKELKDGANITVVGAERVPFENIFGRQIGEALQELHEKNGVKFQLGNGVKKIEGKDKAQKVVLLNGKEIDADLVLLGTGISPNTQFVGNLKTNQNNGGIETDVFLKTSQENVFAAGDVASYPYWPTGQQVRIEHHNEAIYQGYVAALNMLGNSTPVAQIPFFWTRQWDQGLQYTGHTQKFDDIIIQGDVKALKFVAYYVNKDKVVAAAAMASPNAIMIINEALRTNLMPSADQIRKGQVTLEQIKEKLVKSGTKTCHCTRKGNN